MKKKILHRILYFILIIKLSYWSLSNHQRIVYQTESYCKVGVTLRSLEKPSPSNILCQQQGKDPLVSGTKEEQEMLSSPQSCQQMLPNNPYRDHRNPMKNSLPSLLYFYHSTEKRSMTALAKSGPAENMTKQLYANRSLLSGERKWSL